MRCLRWVIIIAAAVTVVAAGWLLWRAAGSAETRQAGPRAAAAAGPKLAAIPQRERGIMPPAAPVSSAAAPSAAAGADPRAELLGRLQQAIAGQPNAVAGEMMLSFRDRAALERFVKKLGGSGVSVLGMVDKLNALRVGFKDLARLRDLIADAGGEVSAEANLWMRTPQEPAADTQNEGGTTPLGKAQQMMDAIAAGGDRSQWGQGVTVAVLDSGVLEHPTFAKEQVTRLDLVGDGAAPHSHGTSVASLIAGQNAQAPGVAPAAGILDIRVANAEGYTVSSLLAQGIIEAADRGARVLNVSLGGYGDSATLRAAIEYAWQKGAVVVAAAGNESYAELSIPAAYDGVMSVGSVDAARKQASFSNSGQGLDITAPGVGVVSAWETDKVAIASGTSHSAALVSGAAAAYLSWGVSNREVLELLKRHATPTGAPQTQVGSGILTIKPNAGR